MPIVVKTDIPHANVGDVAVSESSEMVYVTFAPAPHGGPEVMWFCFRIERTEGRPGEPPTRSEKLRLLLKNFGNLLGGGQTPDVYPVYRPAGGDWARMGAPTLEPLPDGRMNVSWMIETPKTFADVALCYPYGRNELGSMLLDTDRFYSADTIGISQRGRAIERLSNGSGEVGSSRPGVYLIARQHSGETPGSWVLDGFLRAIAAMGEGAPLVWCVPFANIDGVERGDYGKDGFPYDLNRAWGSPPMRHETLVIQRDMHRWKERCRPVIALDFHAPGVSESDGMFCYLPNPKTGDANLAAVTRWADVLKSALGSEFAAADFARVVDYASRWETPTFAAFCAGLGLSALSLETPYSLRTGGAVFTRDLYREAGARLAQAFVRQASQL